MCFNFSCWWWLFVSCIKYSLHCGLKSPFPTSKLLKDSLQCKISLITERQLNWRKAHVCADYIVTAAAWKSVFIGNPISGTPKIIVYMSNEYDIHILSHRLYSIIISCSRNCFSVFFRYSLYKKKRIYKHCLLLLLLFYDKYDVI